MRVAFFTPLPPTPTGIADYSHDLLEGLSSRDSEWIIETITETGEPQPSLNAGVHSANGFALPPGALPVYQMGNSSHHDFIYPFAYRHSGVLVLHDLVLHHSRLASYLNKPEVAAYRADMGSVEKRDRALARIEEYKAEVEMTYPDKGAEVAEVAVRTGGGRILYAYPLYELLARTSKMTLVHSLSARRQITESCPGCTVERVRMGVELPTVVEREEARRRLNQGPGIILASFGLVTPEKRITTALRCVRRLINEGVDVDYYLVGPTVSHFDALEEARGLDIAHRVHQTGRVSQEDFWLYAFAADLCLNLRYPSAGETSATLLRLLAAGRAVMVTDQVHHLDFPDTVVSRVSLEGDEDGLFCDVMDLLRHPRRRLQFESNSRRFISEEHTIEVMVDDYVAYFETARDMPTPDTVLPEHLTS